MAGIEAGSTLGPPWGRLGTHQHIIHGNYGAPAPNGAGEGGGGCLGPHGGCRHIQKVFMYPVKPNLIIIKFINNKAKLL